MDETARTGRSEDLLGHHRIARHPKLCLRAGRSWQGRLRERSKSEGTRSGRQAHRRESTRASVSLPPATADGDPPPAARTHHQVRHQATDPRRLLEEAQDPRPNPDRGARPRPPPTGPVRASTTVELYRAEAEQLLEPLQGSAPAERLGSEIGPVARGRRWRDRPDGAPQHLPAPRLLGGFRVLLSRESRRRSIRFCDREN